MKRCINKEFVAGVVGMAKVFLGIVVYFYIVLGEMAIFVPELQIHELWYASIVWFNAVAIMYIIYKIPSMFSYMFPKC